MIGYELDNMVFDFKAGIFFFATTSRPALRPNLPPIHWIPRAGSLGLKWPERDADHSLPSVIGVNNARASFSTLP
jgi:hypothetical protein